jgi:hypothetical protein
MDRAPGSHRILIRPGYNPLMMRALVVVPLILALGLVGQAVARDQSKVHFTHPRDIDNRYDPLTENDRCVLRGHEDGARVKLVRTLLDRSKTFHVNGETVHAAIIQDSEFEDGELGERTLDYFAQDDRGTVWYLGEDVDKYENGKVVGHGGAWLYGKDTDKMGVEMAAHPRVGTRWRHERVPGITHESDRVVAVLDKATVRGTTYHDVVRVREHTRPDDEVEFKLYAPGVGNITDGGTGLVRCS